MSARLPVSTFRLGDCREILAGLPEASVDSIVCDPPYELGFMGKTWDSSGIAYDAAMWAECLRVLKPGGHLLAFGGTRTYHRMTVAIEDAGFEIRDSIHWIYGSGFPKSLDVSKAIDKAAGAVRARQEPQRRAQPSAAIHASGFGTDGWSPQVREAATPEAAAWSGWGTALKPAHEPIVVARKPLVGTVAGNVLAHGTGALNIDGCRVGMSEADRARINSMGGFGEAGWTREDGSIRDTLDAAGRSGPLPAMGAKAHDAGRWPANVILDEDAAAEMGEPARFFYCAKASSKERPVGPDGTKHATVKPLALMRWLVRLVTPPGGTVLDPFAGSGTTLEAAILEGFDCFGIEAEIAHVPLVLARIDRARAA